MRRLLIRPGGIGDCLTCFPAMEWLRVACTEVWVPSAVVPLVQFAGRVRSIVNTGLDLLGIDSVDAPAALYADLAQFDEIVSWYGSNRPEFRREALRANPSWRFLQALPPDGYAGHVTDFHADQVDGPRGLYASIDTGDYVKRNTAVIQPFSGGRKKNWNLARFQSLAERLPVHVEWVAGSEEQLPEAYRQDNLFELAKWIRGASVYIGNDSGITHLAAATGVPTVALFGESDVRIWSPRGHKVNVLARNSMDEIDADDVLSAVLPLLEQGARP